LEDCWNNESAGARGRVALVVGETSCDGVAAAEASNAGSGIMRRCALGDLGGVGGRGCKPVSPAPEETETGGKSTMLFFRIRGGCVDSGTEGSSRCDGVAPTGVIDRR
jgi:hypothetical protein